MGHEKRSIEIPSFVAHLPCHGGLPVPYFIAWANGVPEFRVIDGAVVIKCVQKSLCGICGRRLGEYAYVIGGPRSRESHFYSDPPMHKKCAEWATEVCPFLRGEITEYADRPVASISKVNELMARELPKQMFMLRVRVKETKLTNFLGESVIEVGKYWGETEL